MALSTSDWVVGSACVLVILRTTVGQIDTRTPASGSATCTVPVRRPPSATSIAGQGCIAAGRLTTVAGLGWFVRSLSLLGHSLYLTSSNGLGPPTMQTGKSVDLSVCLSALEVYIGLWAYFPYLPGLFRHRHYHRHRQHSQAFLQHLLHCDRITPHRTRAHLTSTAIIPLNLEAISRLPYEIRGFGANFDGWMPFLTPNSRNTPEIHLLCTPTDFYLKRKRRHSILLQLSDARVPTLLPYRGWWWQQDDKK